MFQAELTAKITAAIKQAARDDVALDQVQRAAKEAALRAEMLDCERCEVSLIHAAEAKGEMLDYRRDTSP